MLGKDLQIVTRDRQGAQHVVFDGFIVRAEYLHYDFGTTTYVTPAFTTNAAATIDVVRGGLSYKF